MNLKLNYMFFTMLIFSIILMISSFSWFSLWMSIEFNLIFFIPMIINNKKYSIESSIIYYLIQSLASNILLLFILMSFMKFNINMILFMFIISTLMLKIGSAPLHFWFPKMMKKISWNNSFILMSLQKFGPMTIVTYCLMLNYLMIFIIFSTFMGAMKGLFQSSIRKIMAYSSINHMSWMFTLIIMNNFSWKFYFFLYSFIILNLTKIFKIFNLMNFNQMTQLFSNNKYFYNMIFFNLFSLGGLPPFLGFFLKMISIILLINNKYFILTMILIIFSLITLFFYLRMSIFLLMKKKMTKLKSVKIQKYKLLMNINFMNFLMILFMLLISMYYY